MAELALSLRRALTSVAATSAGASLVAALVALAVNVLMSRALGPEARGEVAWVLQWAYVVAPLLALGVERDALRGGYPGRGPSQHHLWVLTLLALGPAALFAGFGGIAAVCVAAAGASVAIERGAGVARRRLRTFLVLHLAVQLWILTASTVLFVTEVTNIDLWLGVYALPAAALVALHVWRTVPAHVPRRLGDLFKGVSPQTLHYMLGGLGTLLATRVERLLLPALASPRQLGLYVSVATASEMLVWLARGLGDSRVSTMVGREVARRRVFLDLARDSLVFSALAVPMAALMWGVLIPLLGPGFSDAKQLVLPLCVASVTWSCYFQLSSAWLAHGSGPRSAMLDGATAALTTVVCSVMIIQWGALGAALGCAISYAVMAIVAAAAHPGRKRSD